MTKADARSLAVRYGAFNSAQNDDSRRLWAFMLREIQIRLDIELISRKVLDSLAA